MKKICLRLVKIVLVVILAVSLFMLVRQQVDYSKAAKDYAEASALAKRSSTSSGSIPGRAIAPEETGTLPAEVLALIDLDLEALREVNSDVVGWIEIPGTQLSYPLMQGSDNQFYLSHTWSKAYNAGGSIFLESTSSPDFSDFHTIIYGHRMHNDTMFNTLKYYEALSFQQEHPSVYIVLDSGVYQYDIFAAFETGLRQIVYQLDLEGREEEFFQFSLANSVIDTGITPQIGDQILTLSTCTSSNQSKRWVVQAILQEEYH